MGTFTNFPFLAEGTFSLHNPHENGTFNFLGRPEL